MVNQYSWLQFHHKEKEHSKQLCEKVIKKNKSGDGYKFISKSLNIPCSPIEPIIKKWKEYGKCVNLLATVLP